MTDEILLSVEELTIAFRSGDEWNNALENVSFQVRKGKVMGIVGESGSGKTVSSLACMGLLPQHISKVVNGSALFQGKDLLADDFDWEKHQRKVNKHGFSRAYAKFESFHEVRYAGGRSHSNPHEKGFRRN